MALQTYIGLSLDERCAFELVCARRGFAPMDFDVAASESSANGECERHVTIRRGCWSQSYWADGPGQWIHQFETDLVCRFFK
jgi:hypothetical protein